VLNRYTTGPVIRRSMDSRLRSVRNGNEHMFVMTKPAERALAREMREAGLPYKRIAAELGVSPSSVYLWASDIALTEEQVAFNLRGPRGPQNPERVRRRAESWAAKCRATRLVCQQDGRQAAHADDLLHQAGCMLYWAEGAKSQNSIQFTNSDAHMLRLFRRFLTEALGIRPVSILFSINVYTNNGLTLEEIERHWLEVLDLPSSNARKHVTNHMPTSSSGKAKNRLPYGVCTLRVHNTWMLQHIYGAIQEYAGFDEPAWLR
jgi:Homeodomain-like domain